MAVAWWGSQLYRPLLVPAGEQQLSVHPGEGLTALLLRLQATGWQLPLRQMQIYARLAGMDRSIRSGDYSLQSCCASALGLLELLTSGQQMTHRVTLVEGWDFRQIHSALDASPKLMLQIAADPVRAAVQFGTGYESLEGLFYPDTYDYASGESGLAVLRRARLRQRELLDRLWAERDPNLPYQTPYEAVILASIVEREARIRDEAPRIAGVYVSRLRKGMRLEADPTVIYGLGNDYSRALTLKDLRTDTPWNTYRNAGLPPTPIGMPGQEALEAALKPHETGMLFFVARGDGSHIFAPTLKEHHQNVRRVRAAQRRASQQ